MTENERCIIQSLLTEVVGSNLLKYFKSFFCLRQNLCLSELLLENWNSSACFSSLTGWVVFYSPAWCYRDFSGDVLTRNSDYLLNICKQNGYFGEKNFVFPQLVTEGCCGQEQVDRSEVLRVTLWRRLSQARPSWGTHSAEPSWQRSFFCPWPGAPLWVRMCSLVFRICLFEYRGTNIFLKLSLYLSSMLKEGKKFLSK